MRPSDLKPSPSVAQRAPDPARVLSASEDCIKVIDRDGLLRFMNPSGQRLLEIDDFAAFEGAPYESLWPQEMQAVARDAVARALAGQVARFSGVCPTMRGTLKHWDVVVSPMRDDAGAVEAAVAVSRDVTEQKRAEDAAMLLARELAHRIKNLFAVVDGMIAMSARRAPEAARFAETLRARLNSFGRAIAFVAPGAQGGAGSLHGLLRELLSPFDEGGGARIAIVGADARIGANGGTALALVVHELATNAVKYGALSRPGGRVTVSLQREDGALAFTWQERGGPPPAETREPGFGATLMNNAASVHLGGELAREWSPEGLVARLRIDPEALAR